MTAKHPRNEPRPPDWKANMAKGQNAAVAIRRYFAVIAGLRDGTITAPRDAARRLASIEARLAVEHPDPITQVKLIQERMDLLAQQAAQQDLAAVEETFISHVGWYSEQHGISYAAWREMGVEASVLARAGIKQSGTQAQLALGTGEPTRPTRPTRQRTGWTTKAIGAKLVEHMTVNGPLLTTAESRATEQAAAMFGMTTKLFSNHMRILEEVGAIVVIRTHEGGRPLIVSINLPLPAAEPQPATAQRRRTKPQDQAPAA